MTESFSLWSFRAAGAVFAITFLTTLWHKSLQVTPTVDDIADERFEQHMAARYDPPSLVRYGPQVAMGNRRTSRFISKENASALAARFANRFHPPTNPSLPH